MITSTAGGVLATSILGVLFGFTPRGSLVVHSGHLITQVKIPHLVSPLTFYIS